MSDHHNSDAEHEADAVDEDELDANEPHTPGWLTLLGCALFLLVGILVLATDEPADANKSSDLATAAPQAEAVAAPQPAAPTPPAPATALRDPQAARAAAQKLIDQLKLRQPSGGIQPPAPGQGNPAH